MLTRIVIMIMVCCQEVIRLEALCKELYESQDAAARAEAEKALVSFQVKHVPLFFPPLFHPQFLPPEQPREPGKVSAPVGSGQLPIRPAPCHNHHHQVDQPVLKDSVFMFVFH